MDHIDDDADDYDDQDDQFEQMIVENQMLLQSLATLLIRKGVLTQEEIDAEMDKLYEELEQLEDQA